MTTLFRLALPVFQSPTTTLVTSSAATAFEATAILPKAQASAARTRMDKSLRDMGTSFARKRGTGDVKKRARPR